MKAIVISDASVLLTALFGTNDRIATRLDRLLHDKTSEVRMLPFTAVEFANGVRFSTRERDIAKQAIDKFTALDIPVVTIASAEISIITDLSYRLNTTVYDTSYHYVALMHEGVFITCDQSYYKKASQLGHIEFWE